MTAYLWTLGDELDDLLSSEEFGRELDVAEGDFSEISVAFTGVVAVLVVG